MSRYTAPQVDVDPSTSPSCPSVEQIQGRIRVEYVPRGIVLEAGGRFVIHVFVWGREVLRGATSVGPYSIRGPAGATSNLFATRECPTVEYIFPPLDIGLQGGVSRCAFADRSQSSPHASSSELCRCQWQLDINRSNAPSASNTDEASLSRGSSSTAAELGDPAIVCTSMAAVCKWKCRLGVQPTVHHEHDVCHCSADSRHRREQQRRGRRQL